MPPRLLALLSIFLFAAAGCTGAPARVEAPQIDATAVGDQMAAAYDTDKDGYLSKDELATQCPAIAKAFSQYDADGNGVVSASEITARIQAIQQDQVGLMSLECKVTLDNAPLSGAKVEFVAEPAMADKVPNASGTTDDAGSVMLDIPATEKPDSLKFVPGLRCGLYKIRITHPSENIPAKYNSETELGQEVALDAPEIQETIRIKLTRE